jgi:hypothetical protein
MTTFKGNVEYLNTPRHNPVIVNAMVGTHSGDVDCKVMGSPIREEWKERGSINGVRGRVKRAVRYHGPEHRSAWNSSYTANFHVPPDARQELASVDDRIWERYARQPSVNQQLHLPERSCREVSRCMIAVCEVSALPFPTAYPSTPFHGGIFEKYSSGTLPYCMLNISVHSRLKSDPIIPRILHHYHQKHKFQQTPVPHFEAE